MRTSYQGRLPMNRSLNRTVRIAILIGPWLLAVLFWSVPPIPAFASSPIVLDSAFADWAGQVNIADDSGDASADKWDITRFWWADDVDLSKLFWRVDRVSNSKKVTYVLHIDINNNGNFNDSVDREVVVDYKPREIDSQVDVKVRYGDTQATISQTKNNDWGESVSEGGRYVEFTASFADLGLNPSQVIRIYATTQGDNSAKDRAPDAGDIQWSVVNILGYPLLAGFMIGVSLVIWRMRGRWAWTKV